MGKLTVAQAETLFALFEDGYADGIPFTAYQAFPNRNNRDNGMRRVCKTLAKKGLLAETQVYGDSRLEPGYTVIMPDAQEAFTEWAKSKDYDFSEFSPS